ncbi:TPA: SMI1/KNR4 family protein [Streptococcus suis]|nr:SMI1/KNR4 family protein [Streptococcus suis]
MSQLLEKIKTVEGLYSSSPASEQEVVEAESKLRLTFPADYKDYLKEFGVISFYGTEWNGLKGDTWTDVVATTLEARSLYENFPKEKFILEDLHFDNMLVLADSTGKVFLWHNGLEKEIHSSISSYLEECVARKDTP